MTGKNKRIRRLFWGMVELMERVKEGVRGKYKENVD